MNPIKGSPGQGLAGATLGFFIGFAAVALFGPTAAKFQQLMHLSPMAVGFLVAMPSLSGSLLRIPFSAWVDTTGGRKPFLVLLSLSVIGMAGLSAVVAFLYPSRLTESYYPLLLGLAILCGCGIATFSVGISQVSYWFSKKAQGRALAIFGGVGNLAPGIFSMLIPMALSSLGLSTSYLIWLGMLAAGAVLYFLIARNAPYFQLCAQCLDPDEARRQAGAHGQVLFPAGSLKDSLAVSARLWRTWALVTIYFTTFGGFIALTAWLPTYWTAYFGMTAIQAGMLTALYSVLTSLIRILGGVVSDKLREGGENTAILALFIMLMGALVMIGSRDYQLAIPGEILLAFGMGICNAAVFKMVPQAAPKAVGGAAGWVGGLGAFGGFAIPPMLAFAVRDLGRSGYSIGFIVYLFLALLSLFMTWILKYSEIPASDVPKASVPDREKVPA
ncbi:MAG TPA: MFS transporter [Bryobacteraceae bacterium]|nr:MFS transporter [Bryobacteraceae bacterium]